MVHTEGRAEFEISYFACSPENFCGFFLRLCLGICIEKRWGFLVNFFWSPFPTKRSTKTHQKIRGKFGAKFGTKILKIRDTFVLQFFWPSNFHYFLQVDLLLQLSALKWCMSSDIWHLLPARLQRLVGENSVIFCSIPGNLAGISWDFSDPRDEGLNISGQISVHFSLEIS